MVGGLRAGRYERRRTGGIKYPGRLPGPRAADRLGGMGLGPAPQPVPDDGSQSLQNAENRAGTAPSRGLAAGASTLGIPKPNRALTDALEADFGPSPWPATALPSSGAALNQPQQAQQHDNQDHYDQGADRRFHGSTGSTAA